MKKVILTSAMSVFILAVSSIPARANHVGMRNGTLTSGTGCQLDSPQDCISGICYPTGGETFGICSDCATSNCSDNPTIIERLCNVIECHKDGPVHCGTITIVIQGVGGTRDCFKPHS